MAVTVKESTYSESVKPLEEVEQQEVAEVQPEVQVEAQTEVQNNVQEQVQEAEESVSFDIPTEEVKEEVKPTDWREAIKAVDKKELLKELAGVELDEFDLEFAKARKNGVDPYKYIEAKFFDWNKVSDIDLMKGEFSKKYGHLDPEEQAYLFNKKYGISEVDDDDVAKDKRIALKADAYEIRQQRIAEQQNFKIPESAQPQVQQADNGQEQMKQFIISHEATKSLLESKRVAVNAGEDGKFNFSVNNPQVLLDMMLDGKAYQKYTTNEKGEPDMGKLYKVALFTVNPEKYEKDLINYGKQLGKKALLDEGQNAKRPIERPAIPAPQGSFRVTGTGKVGR